MRFEHKSQGVRTTLKNAMNTLQTKTPFRLSPNNLTIRASNERVVLYRFIPKWVVRFLTETPQSQNWIAMACWVYKYEKQVFIYAKWHDMELTDAWELRGIFIVVKLLWWSAWHLAQPIKGIGFPLVGILISSLFFENAKSGSFPNVFHTYRLSARRSMTRLVHYFFVVSLCIKYQNAHALNVSAYYE